MTLALDIAHFSCAWVTISFALYGLLRFGSEKDSGCGMFIVIAILPFLITWFILCDVYGWIFGRTA